MTESRPRVRVKFGLNPYDQEFTCSCCRKKFLRYEAIIKDGTPDNKSLFLRLEVNGEVMDFPICNDCSPKGLFETRTVIIKDNPSHPIGFA